MTGPFAGVEITARSTPLLGDARFEPFWAAAEETGALVFVHPTTTRGFAGPDEHYLWNTVGNPMETTITAAHLVMSGVLERHPGLRILLAHGGGALLVAARPAAPRARAPRRGAARLREPVEDVAAAAALRHDHARPGAAARAGRVRRAPTAGAAGSDHPFDMADPDPVATVPPPGLDPDEPSILGNAERLTGMNDARSSSRARATTA